MFDKSAEKLISDIWADIQRQNQKRQIENVKADPQKHAMTMLMAEGKSASWRYYVAGMSGGKQVRFAYSVHRNLAGNFLMWREIVTFGRRKGRKYEKQIKRDQFAYSGTKEEAIKITRRRRDAWLIVNKTDATS